MVRIYVDEIPESKDGCPFYNATEEKCNLTSSECCLTSKPSCMHLIDLKFSFEVKTDE